MTTNGEFDPVGLLEVLNRHGVKYVVIGGFAATAYGSPLPTTDIDVTPEQSKENMQRLSAALSELDARVRVDGIPEGLEFPHSAESLVGISVLNLSTRLGELDLVVRAAGELDYCALATRALSIRIHDVDIPLAALDDVISSKEAANREKDRRALPILRALRDRLAEESTPRQSD